MNILKKAAACFAAAAVMTSMAVTASADYQIAGQELDDSYVLKITGIPQDVFDYDVPQFEVGFTNSDGSANPMFITLIIFNNDGAKVSCYVTDDELMKDGRVYEHLNAGFLPLADGEMGLVISFKKDSECLAEFMNCTKGYIAAAGGTINEEDTGNGIATKNTFYNSNGDIQDNIYGEPVSFTWQAMSAEDNSNDSTSSESESEPVSEPVSSEPVSEPASSETATSQPSNVDTGTAGVAAVIGTAVLAAGAVIVTRKKNR